jgi:hypothetical protein
MEGQSTAWAASCEAVLAAVFPRASAGGSLPNWSRLDEQTVIGDLAAEMFFGI